MIEIIGPEESAERDAAERVKTALIELWPDLQSAGEDHVKISASAKIFGYEIQDIDVLVVACFGTERRFNPVRALKTSPGGTAATRGVRVRSLVVVIEVKGHDQRYVRFTGGSAEVRYARPSRPGWHSATEQSLKQAHVVRAYLADQGVDLWVTNLIYFPNLEEIDLPRRPHNVIAGRITGRGLLTVIGELSRPWWPQSASSALLSAGKQEAITKALAASIFRQIEPTQLDRRRMDRISRRLGLRDEWVEQLGKRQIVLRGRGGAGKTVILLQMAHRAFEEHGARTLILTYNLALAADMRRIMALLNLPSTDAEGGVRIESVMSFIGRVLRLFGTLSDQRDFLEQYMESCAQLSRMLAGKEFAPDDVEQALSGDGEKFAFDLIMIDEAQDWPVDEIEILRACYPVSHFVIADGVDQLVRGARASWTAGVPPTMQRVIQLRKCLRLKWNLALFADALAEELGLDGWRVEGNEEIRGGRILIVEGNYLEAPDLNERLIAETIDAGNSPIDVLYCVPSSLARRERPDGSTKFAAYLAQSGRSCWDGTAADVRREIPRSALDVRLVQYESCRGLEGWTVVCLGFDEFWDRHMQIGASSAYAVDGASLTPEESGRLEASRWAMIPVTRAMDTLVINISTASSELRHALKSVRGRFSDEVEWIVVS